MRKKGYSIPHILTALLFAIFPLLLTRSAYGAPILQSSVTIADSTPNAITSHAFQFTLASVSNVGSIKLEYCINSVIINNPCNPAPGFSAAGAILTGQTGETGFAVSPLTNTTQIILTRTPVPSSAIPVTYNFDNLVNPSTNRGTVLIRISTYATDDASGPYTDGGVAAFATLTNPTVEGFVPPYLTFCVGVVVALDCTNSTGTLLDFGELVTNQARFVSSQFAVATNDPTGYATSVTGSTMTSGNNIIPAMNSPGTSQPGKGQFGMNLRANSSPSVGGEPIGVGTGAVAPGFNVPNQFFFEDQVVAISTLPTESNAFTVSYIVNIDKSQRPGIYSTTLTYIASAAF